MKAHKVVVTILTILLFAHPVSGQENGIFHYLDKSSVTLTERQQELIDIIFARPQSSKIHFVHIDQHDVIGESIYLILNLPNVAPVVVHQQGVNYRNERGFAWIGRLIDEVSMVHFEVWENDITALIQTSDLLYMLEPLGDGLHVLVEIAQSNSSEELGPIEYDQKSDWNKAGGQTGQESTQSRPVIDVLVAYTTSAKNSSGNISQLISSAVGLTNDSFLNSHVSAEINLVHLIETSYTESGDLALDLDRLRLTSDGHIDNIHAIRNQYGADLVVLIVGSGNGCGVAYLKSTASTAFSVTRYDCAISNYTFAHEIGHNMGAHHDRGTHQNTHYAFGHGYQNIGAGWRTIMAYAPGSRINYWSNPNKLLGGLPMGTTLYEDNARVWDERATAVAAFKSYVPPPPSPPALSINTSGFSPELSWSSVSGATSYNIYAGSVAGAPGTVNCNSVLSFSLLDATTSTSYTDYSVIIDPYESTFVCYQVTAVHGSGETAPSNQVGTQGMAPLKEVADRRIPSEFSLLQNYPNPFNPTTTFQFGLPETAQVSLKVYTVAGQWVATLTDGSVNAGFHEVSWDASRFPSGMYIVRMQAVGASGESHRFVRKLTLLK